MREDLEKNCIDTRKEDLIFQAIDWYPSDIKRQAISISLDGGEEGDNEEEEDNMEYCVKCFGVDRQGRSVGLNLYSYKPFFYVQIKGLDISDSNVLKHVKSKIFDELNVKYKCQINEVSVVDRVNLYGFTNGEKQKYIRLTFPNWRSFKYASYNFKMIRYRSRQYTVIHYESNLEPFLRMLHILGVQPCGWIKVPQGKYRLNDDYLKSATTLDLEANWDDIQPHEGGSIAPLVIASFDIECTSSHGDFPMAIKNYNKTSKELFDYYKSLTQNKKVFHTKKEIKEKIQHQLLSLFDIPHDMECKDDKKILTYVIPKTNNYDKNHMKFAIENHTYDLLHLMKDKPKSEKVISEFMKRDLRIPEPKIAIDKIKSMYETLTRFSTNEVKVRKSIMIELLKYNSDLDPFKFQTKINNNMECIMGLFDKSTIYDKISDKFLKMGFPTLEGDPIIQIGTTFHKYGEKECFFKSIITLDAVEDIEDADEIIECKKERDIIMQWRDMIMRMDPDVIVGYNIFGFDNGYIHDRSKELRILNKVQNLGRLTDFRFDKYNPSFVVKELQSSALGQNILKYFVMHGRVQIDLMKLVQKDYKLDSYKLDTVASTFITGKITSVVDTSTITIDQTQGVHENHFIKIGAHKYRILEKEGHELRIDNEDKNEIDLNSKWGLIKDDVSPNEIFQCQRGSDADRAKIAKYCLQDCSLCNYLIMKLEVIANNLGMSNVCLVPLSYIFLRGQGIKIFSLVSKQCLDDGFMVPVVRKADDDFDESYEGAIVLTPDIGIYSDPISVLDFASLYPSSMISENISHDSIVLDDKYDNLPGVEYNDIQYEVNGVMQTVRFAQFEGQGVLPRILNKLLKQRKLTRKKMNYKSIELESGDQITGMVISETKENLQVKNLESGTVTDIETSTISSVSETYNEFEKAVLDGLQLAYKITANSLYGQVGAKTSPIFLKELAASTTATGRNLVLKLKDFAEDNYDCKVVYGDSVTPDTPILIRQEGTIRTCRIDSLVESYEERDDGKQIAHINAEVWTETGFTAIHQIVRHKTRKTIHRVLTHTGVVDVTEDHSLLLDDGDIIKPGEVNVGTKLLHGDSVRAFTGDPDEFVSIEEAKVMGFFFGDGSCGHYGNKYTWALNNSNLENLIEMQNLCPFETSIYDTLGSSRMYKLNAKGQVKAISAKYRSLFYNEHNEKVVPSCILNGPIAVVQSFWRGYCMADGDKDVHGYTRFDIKGKEGSMGMCILGRRLGYNVSINTRRDKPNVFRQTFTTSAQRKDPIAIKKIEIVGETDGYVYDLTTESHHFHVGPGDLVVHNTDSIFIKFLSLPDENGEEKTGKDRLQASIDKSIELSNAFKPHLKSPHDAEYEKTFWPFIILSKKRYVGNLYEEDVNKFKEKSMGIVLKRRDNANILKKVYGGMINIILNQNDITKSIAFLKNQLNLIQNESVPIGDLIISKTLKGSYADPSKISHKVLADRMLERDPGSAPQVNDRVQYVYICNPDKNALQGDRIESPEYIKANNITIDYSFYITNQIMKPVCQLLSLVLESISGYKRPKGYFEEMESKYTKKLGDVKAAKEKVQSLKEAEVEKLIFEPVLVSIKKKMKNQKSIYDFF